MMLQGRMMKGHSTLAVSKFVRQNSAILPRMHDGQPNWFFVELNQATTEEHDHAHAVALDAFGRPVALGAPDEDARRLPLGRGPVGPRGGHVLAAVDAIAAGVYLVIYSVAVRAAGMG